MRTNDAVGPVQEDQIEEVIEEDVELLPSASGMLQTGTVKNADDIFWLAENSDRLIEAHNKISNTILKIAKPGDWVTFSSDADPEGTAELGFAGAFRIGKFAGVSYVDRKVSKVIGRDNHGEWIRYEAEVTCIFRGTQVRTWGRASTRDPFFGIKDGQLKKIEDIKLDNLKMAAIRGACKEGIKVLLGLHHFPMRDLKEAGIIVRSTKGHHFGSNKPAQAPVGSSLGGKISEPQQKRLFALCKVGGRLQEDLKKYLKANYNIESSAEIKREDYEKICIWAEGKTGVPTEL